MINLPDGKYTFQNIETGDYLTYNYDNGQAIFPSGVDETKATTLYLTNMENDGSRIHTSDHYGRIKCLSQQWWYEGDATNTGDKSILGGNWLAALYACGIGPNKVPSTVEPAKQVFAFIPVRAEAKVEVSAGVKEVAKSQLKVAAAVLEDAGIDKIVAPKEPEADAEPAKPKESPKPVEEKPKAAPKAKEPKPEPSPKPEEKKPAPVPEEKAYSEPAETHEAAPAPKKCLRRRSFDHRRRAEVAARTAKDLAARHGAIAAREASLTKRQVQYIPDEYFIVGRDHLMDMQTRALSGMKDQQVGTDIWSTRLEVFDKSSLQRWRVTKVD